jgi:hypothetical protein
VELYKLRESGISVGKRGQYTPLYPNDSPENRARNRRVDITIVFPHPEDEPIGSPFQIPVQPDVRPATAGGVVANQTSK